MKHLLIIPLGLLLFSCGNSGEAGDSPEELKAGLQEQYDGFIKNDKTAVVEHFAFIEEVKQQAKLDLFKPAFMGDEAKGITLDFEKPNVYQIVANMFPDSSALGANNKVFGKEIKLRDLHRIIEMPLDSFRPAFNEKGRYNEFERITTKIKEEIGGMEYVLVLKAIKINQPMWYGSTYKPGIFEGKLLLYDKTGKNLLASLELEAMSSGSVTAGQFDDLGQAADVDFLRNINKAIEEKLEESFDVKGKPSSLQSRK